MTMQKGSEIIKRIMEYFVDATYTENAIIGLAIMNEELRGKVVVPEDEWNKREEKWNRIKALIENFPKYKMKDDNLTSSLVLIRLERNKWIEELRDLIEEDTKKKN